MSASLVPIVVGIGVIVLVGAFGLVLSKPGASDAEQRLDVLSGNARKGAGAKADPSSGMLLRPKTLDFGRAQRWSEILPNMDNLGKLYEQADVGIPFRHFLFVPAALTVFGAVMAIMSKLNWMLVPLAAAFMGMVPFMWLKMRKKKRIKLFTSQMPDALELIARALRAGHGLASGLNVVAEEMPAPISHEFGRVFEEQNLGIPLEEALRGLSDRVPTMDVRFFVTSVVIQRATGGDLAEVLDKIGRIIRERFQIFGQVQALTGEGRLSGVVLLGLPPSCLGFIYMLNPEYAGLLFSTPLGVKMLTIAGIFQVVGAVAIKKIITIKV